MRTLTTEEREISHAAADRREALEDMGFPHSYDNIILDADLRSITLRGPVDWRFFIYCVGAKDRVVVVPPTTNQSPLTMETL